VWWAKLDGEDARGFLVHNIVMKLGADILCVTEAAQNVLPDEGYAICSQEFGWDVAPELRKVWLWSNQPWTEVNDYGNADLPSGRMVMGKTQTPIGEIRVIGICTPWQNAHVRDGRRDRRKWEEHEIFLRALKSLTANPTQRTIIVGNFNQRIPSTYQPDNVYHLLQEVLTGYQLATEGKIAELDEMTIDHLAFTPELKPTRVWGWSKVQDNIRLSDHDGVAVELAKA
jgi:endonuclease/exonuclease/phosphatase family metal-dependent hydrolase